jgi:hypothetical protein
VLQLPFPATLPSPQQPAKLHRYNCDSPELWEGGILKIAIHITLMQKLRKISIPTVKKSQKNKQFK